MKARSEERVKAAVGRCSAVSSHSSSPVSQVAQSLSECGAKPASLPPPAHFRLAAMDEPTGLPLAFGKKAPPKKADTSRIATTKRADAPVQPVSSPHSLAN